jgi:tetratricopeptide (TPR) repeat protein
LYIFTTSSIELNNTKYQNLNYQIIRNLDSLTQQLQDDIQLCEIDFILLTVAPASSEEILFSSILPKQEASFLFEQMFKEIIYRLKFDSGSKDAFINFCRAEYANNNKQLSVVEDFARNYRPNKALSWLTKPCFISQILNRALRTREIDIVYKLGFFIKQVNLQLNRLHVENASIMKNIAVVYRGKTVTNAEFDTQLKDTCGGFLSFPNFLITTIDKQVVVDFVDRRLAAHPDRMGIIFEIHIDQTLFSEKNSFALLKDIDMNKDEICFNMSTVFRIESMEQTINDGRIIWLVNLKLINDDDQQLLRLTASARTDDMHTNPGPYLGKLLIDMGEYRRAEQVFLALLKDSSVLGQPRRLVRAQNGLAAVYAYKHEHVKALHHYEQGLQMSLTYLQPDHPDLLPIYIAIGNIYLDQSDYVHAIENYEKAMTLLKYDTQQVNSEIHTDLHTRINKARQSIQSNH